jgi:hypothetical protein
MAKRQRRIAEVVSTTEATPIQDNLTNGKVAEVVSKTSEVTTPTTEEEEPLLGGNSVTIDSGSGKVTTTGAGQYVAPGTALNNAIQSNTAAQTTENAVLKAGIDNAETAGQVLEAPKVAEEAKKEAEKIQANLDVNAVNAFTNMSEEQKQAYGQATANQLANQTANETVENVRVAPAAYNAVTGGPKGPIRPPYESIANKEQVEKDIAKDYRDLTSNIPEAVVEKLGVQDYYPEIGRDIAVGTFSGSRIGSQTIYSGAGGLLPQGLYDARKRALNESAKAKQTALDKYYSGIDIASQFKPKFNETVNDAMDNLLYKKHGGNVNAFLADPESRREFSRLEAVAKNVNGYDAYASSVLKDAADDTKFIDPEQVKNAQDIKRALVDDLDGILTGKKDLAPLFAKAQVYQNIIPQVDKVLKEVLDPNRVGRLPINMRTGGVYDDPTFVAERDQFMQKLGGGTLKQTEYISGFKKFFTGNYEQVIDGLIGSTKYSAQQKDAAMNYVAGQLQEQVELENKFVDSGNIEAARLAEDKRQFNAEYARKIKEGETPWTVRNNMMSSTNPSTGKTIQQEFIDMKKQGLTGTALKNKMLQTARQYGFTAATWDSHTNSVVLKENATPNESSKTYRVNPSNTQAPVMVKVFVLKNGKKVPKTITANELANSKPGVFMYQDGKSFKKFNDYEINLYKTAIKNNQLGLKTQYYESSWGSVGSQTGKMNPINTNNIGDYSLDRAVNIKNSVGSAYYLKPLESDPTKSQAIALPGTIYSQANINDENSRRSEDSRWGDDKKQFGYTMQGGTSSESSGSASSSNE